MDWQGGSVIDLGGVSQHRELEDNGSLAVNLEPASWRADNFQYSESSSY